MTRLKMDKKGKVDKDNELELCFVCCSKVHHSNGNEKVLRNNLLVIFLLKNVMQVTDDQLVENLKSYGNPFDWIRLCDGCTQLSSHAFDLHCQIVKIDRELWSVQKLIVEKVRASNHSLVSGTEGYQSDIWGRTRSFVKNSNFQCGSLPVNPFIEGDKLATANYYLRKEVTLTSSPFSPVQESDSGPGQVQNGKLPDSINIKTEQSKSQMISDNEDDWLHDDDFNDELNSEKEIFKPNYNNRKLYPRRKRVNGKIKDGSPVPRRKLGLTNNKPSVRVRQRYPNKPREVIAGKFKCYYCPKLFSRVKGCQRHEKERHPTIPGQFPCGICDKVWNSKECLTTHISNAHKKKDSRPKKTDNGEVYKVPPPSKKPKMKAWKKIRVMIKVVKGPLQKRRLRVDGKIKCYFCDKLFARVNGCYRHENEKHAKIPGQFPCDICGKAWNSREYLMKHRRKTHKVGVAKKNEPFPFHGKGVDDSLGLTLKDEGEGAENGSSTETVFSHQKEELDDDNRVDDEYIDSTPMPIIKTEVEIEADHINEKVDGDMVEREDNGLHLDDVRSPEENEDEAEVKRMMEKAMNLALEKSYAQVQKNVKREKVDGKFKCSFCDKLFSKIQNCWRHEKAQHQKREKRIGCKNCDMTFRDRYGLQRHERAAHKENKKGDESEGNIASEGWRHARVPRNLEWVDGKVKCGSCDKWFKTVTALRNHERTHRFKEFIRKHEGGDNGGVFPSSQRRRKFERVDGKLKCRYCDKLFCSKAGLLSHEQRTHLKKPGDFICDMCGKVLSSLEYLAGHKRRFHKVKADGSPWVPKNGKKPGRVDREEYGLVSKDGKSKRGKKYLRVDGKLKCNYCERLFLSVDGLYKHEIEKHPKKPGEFICSHCGMAFNSMNYLSKHTEYKHWMRMNGSPYIPHWVPTRKYKWKKSPL